MLCKICGETEEDKFYSSNKSKCKTCVKEAVHKYRKENREKVMEYDRNRPNHKERAILHKERIQRIKTEEKEKYKRFQNQKNKWAKKNRHKRNASLKLQRAILKGTIKRLSACENCASEKNVQGHHPDYSKPLNVVWLCSSCHSKEHKRLNEEKAYIIEHCICPEQRKIELDKLDAERRGSAVAVQGDLDSDGGELYCFSDC